jgi:hypothetical protein
MLRPAVRIDELGLGGVLDQVADEGDRFGLRPADDGADMGRQEQRLSARAGMGAHQPVAHRLHRHALVGQELGEAELAARIDQRVLADEVFDLGLGRGIERVPGRAHVGELGVAARGGDDAPAQDRVLGRHDTERGVGVPQTVAQCRHAPLVVACQLLARLVEVGDVGEGGVEAQLGILDRGVGAFLERPEIACEGELLLVADVLARQHEHGMAVHAGVDGLDFGWRQRPAHIDTGKARTDVGCQGNELDRHGPILDRRRRPREVRIPQRSAAAMLPPSTVTTAPVVFVALASETKACATSAAVTSMPKRLPPM